MKLLIDAIKSRGRILHNNILKVDEIINHQVDPVLMSAIGDEFYNYFKVTKAFERGCQRWLLLIFMLMK